MQNSIFNKDVYSDINWEIYFPRVVELLQQKSTSWALFENIVVAATFNLI